MKNLNVKSLEYRKRASLLTSLLFACWMAMPARVQAIIGPACLRVTKTCDTVVVGQPNLVTAVVTNCGFVIITNITVSDNLYGNIGTIFSLSPGGSATLT